MSILDALDEAAIHGEMTALGVPGLSVAVAHGGELGHRQFGVRTPGGPAVDADTLFQAGSVSKAVFAAVLLRQVELGTVDLDADVTTYLRSWRVPPVQRWEPRITLRQLLSHTAGTTVHGFEGYPTGTTVPGVPDVLAGEGNSAPVVVDVLPGTVWRYSGGGTTIAQLALSDALGAALPELASDTVFGPAGMTRALFASDLPVERQAHAALGHQNAAEPVPGGWHRHPELAAAGVWATPSDLALFGQNLRSVLREDTLATALQGVTGHPHMGLGFFLQPSVARFGHDGANIGYLSRWLATSDLRTSIAAMTNAMTGMPLLRSVTDQLLAAAGLPPEETGPATPPDAMARLLGTFAFADGRQVVLAPHPHGLSFSFDGQPGVTVAPVHQPGRTDAFAFQLSGLGAWAEVEFLRDPPRLMLHLPGLDLTAVKQA